MLNPFWKNKVLVSASVDVQSIWEWSFILHRSKKRKKVIWQYVIRYVGQPNNRFEFGAHDFRGGSFTETQQESIQGNGSAVADGSNAFQISTVKFQKYVYE